MDRLQQGSTASAAGPISKLAVFIARYNYTPHLDSPNECPDAELPLTAGDYIYVYGDPDDVSIVDLEGLPFKGILEKYKNIVQRNLAMSVSLTFMQ